MYMKRLFDSRNKDVTGLDRQRSENNAGWLNRALKKLDLKDVKQWTLVVLVGGVDQMSFRLRLAQSHLRRDMLPSYWSECLLAEVRGGDITKARLHYVPLIQPDQTFAPSRNGVVASAVDSFSSADDWPNVALLAFPMAQKEVLAYLERFKESRDMLDALAHIVQWLAFAWGTNGTPNPVHQGIGLPSASMVGVVCAAAQLDVAPGMPVKGACPEVLWSTVNYWHEQVTVNGQNGNCARAVYLVGHTYAITDDSPKAKPTTKAKPRTAASNRAAKLPRKTTPTVAEATPPAN